MSGSSPTFVLVCDNSRSDATALQRLLERDGDIKVAGISCAGDDAVEAVASLQPDLVTMSIDAGCTASLRAVEQIMSRHPAPILVLCAESAQHDAEAALAAGALEVLAKSALGLDEPAGEAAADLRRRIAVLSCARVIRHPRGGIRRKSIQPVRRISVIGICASTGGPQILEQLLNGLPRLYPIPMLVVQHVTAGFTTGLARWLRDATGFAVSIATNGIRVTPGVWIAPDGVHLRLTRAGLLTLDSATVRGVHRPSGDILLESIAAAAGMFGAGIVLTGMGEDGAAGVQSVRREGGIGVAQDEASSVIYGMPKVARERGVDFVLSPPEMSRWMCGLRHHPLGAGR